MSFKPETDDMREAASIIVIKELVSRGAAVKVDDFRTMGVNALAISKDTQ